ncbi:DNA ligase [Thraustotheca clavata]|uniref:DNA ligase n=1 Tax=Thraustotheca clavata TaxID=74557 RepID=A0A1W0A5Q0_9STRA|nr:DNA ligase [Thraustotheca clavata]
MAHGGSFSSLCNVLERVAITSKNDAKLKIIFSPELRKVCAGASLYPLLRLILPHLDRERTYKLKEKKLAALYVELLGLSPTSADGKKLLHWTDPTIVTSRAVGDFSMVLQEVMQYRSKPKASNMTIQDVNQLLDELNEYDPEAGNVMAKKKQVLLKFITQFTAEEQKWLVRMVIKDLKVGIRHERVLQFIHPDAVEMFNHTNDLARVCSELTDSMVRYVPQIAPFQVFTPMLAKRLPFGECTQAMNSNSFYMEPKLDGERITCHVQTKEDGSREFQLISRNGINYTEKYGPCISSFVNTQVHQMFDVILDGEMLVWDSVEFKFLSFGSLKSVASEQVQGKNDHKWLCYVVWDIVYLGGKSASTLLAKLCPTIKTETTNIMGLPLTSRLKILSAVLTPLDHRVMRIEQTLVPASLSPVERHERVMADIDKRLSAGYEGLILKDATSHYMCGEVGRKSQRWIKLKPDYAGMTRQLDVIVIGGYYGSGSRRGGAVSHFLLGVLERPLSENDFSVPVVSFCKVGTGYSMEELDALRKHLAPHWQPWEVNKLPSYFDGWSPKSDTKPDVWIRPEDSVCVEIYGFELTYTTEYQTGLTLRFPRLKAIRYDKSWSECLTMAQLNTMKGQQFNQKRAVDVAFGQKETSKRLKSTQKTKRAALDRGHVGVSLAYTQANLDEVVEASKVFQGCTFCVLPGKYPDEMTKQSIEQLLYSHGGTCVQNPHPKLNSSETTKIIAVNGDGVKLRNYMKQGIYDVITIDWICRCIDSQQKEPLRARDYIFTTESTASHLKTQYDVYGDHYTTPVTVEELQIILKSHAFQENTWPKPWQEHLESASFEEQAVVECQSNFFWHCVVYVDQFEDIYTEPGIAEVNRTSEMHQIAQYIKLFGGRIVDYVASNTTHIILPENSERQSRLSSVRPIVQKLRHSFGREPVVVTTSWVYDCLRARQQLPMEMDQTNYQLPC